MLGERPKMFSLLLSTLDVDLTASLQTLMASFT
jgi:hypothetical protein